MTEKDIFVIFVNFITTAIIVGYMAVFQVIGTVNVAQQGKINNHQPVHVHFHKNGSMDVAQDETTEPAVSQPNQDAAPQKEHFKYFTPKAFSLHITDSLEQAIQAACHSSVVEFNGLMDRLTKEGLVNIQFVKKSDLYRHIDSLYQTSFSYEYFRHNA